MAPDEGLSPEFAPAENWNPNTAGPSCDWCGECEWCRNLHGTPPGKTGGE